MKKHWFSIVLYLLSILLILLAVFVYQQPFLVLLLLPILSLPFITIPIFLYTVKRQKAEFYTNTPYIEIGNKVTFLLRITNPTFCPLFAVDAHFTALNLFFSSSKEHILSLSSMPKKANIIEIPIEASKPGMIHLDLISIEYSDYLHFVSITVPMKLVVQVPVLPLSHSVAPLPPTPNSDGLEEYTESDSKGSISSDVKEIREYRPGDRLAFIHWKLSAKLDELLVKEMAHTSVLSLILLPELTASKIEDTASTLRSVMEMLLTREERFEVCLFNHVSFEFQYFLITDDADILDCFIHFYYLSLYDGNGLAKEFYVSSEQKEGTLITICGKDIQIER